MRTDNIIRHEGYTALSEKLDIVEVERFIMLINREKFDYTKWRKSIFENRRIVESGYELYKSTRIIN
ncbi:MAG: hypothetical protein NT007_01240 [Candidatus Kapabacteria bacterium]|nr:hypothetical protein [Candidatus Kapabacteria bacterium]